MPRCGWVQGRNTSPEEPQTPPRTQSVNQILIAGEGIAEGVVRPGTGHSVPSPRRFIPLMLPSQASSEYKQPRAQGSVMVGAQEPILCRSQNAGLHRQTRNGTVSGQLDRKQQWYSWLHDKAWGWEGPLTNVGCAKALRRTCGGVGVTEKPQPGRHKKCQKSHGQLRSGRKPGLQGQAQGG